MPDSKRAWSCLFMVFTNAQEDFFRLDEQDQPYSNLKSEYLKI